MRSKPARRGRGGHLSELKNQGTAFDSTPAQHTAPVPQKLKAPQHRDPEQRNRTARPHAPFMDVPILVGVGVNERVGVCDGVADNVGVREGVSDCVGVSDFVTLTVGV